MKRVKRNQKYNRILWLCLILVIVLRMIFTIITSHPNIHHTSSQRDLLQSETVSIRLGLSVDESDIRELKHNVLDNKIYNSNLHDSIDNMSEILEEYSLKSNEYFIKNYNLNDSALNTLYRITEAECTNQSFESKVNVANVIINRVVGDEFPNTIKKVVFQDKQFSCIKDKRYYKVEITDSTIKAVNYAIASEDTTDGSLFFMNRNGSSAKNIKWMSSLDFAMRDDSGHEFYKNR